MMYVCMYVLCMYYVCIMYVCIMYVCIMYVCMYACMHVANERNEGMDACVGAVCMYDRMMRE